MTTTPTASPTPAPERHRRALAYSASVVVVLVAASLCFAWGLSRPSSSTSVGAQLRDRIAYFGIDSLDGTWNVGTGSYAGYQVDEVLKGVNSTVNGGTDAVTGQAVIDDSTLKSASVDVNLNDVHTSFKARDEYFSSQVVDTNLHPIASFRATEPVDLKELLVDTSDIMQQNSVDVDIPGELDLNGQVMPATAKATVIVTQQGMQVRGVVPMVWQDFGITPPDLNVVKVADSGELQFLLLLTR